VCVCVCVCVCICVCLHTERVCAWMPIVSHRRMRGTETRNGTEEGGNPGGLPGERDPGTTECPSRYCVWGGEEGDWISERQSSWRTPRPSKDLVPAGSVHTGQVGA